MVTYVLLCYMLQVVTVILVLYYIMGDNCGYLCYISGYYSFIIVMQGYQDTLGTGGEV